MDATHFDRVTRMFIDCSSRRGLLRGLASATFSLAAIRFPGAMAAKKKHKKKRKKLKFNQYGCVDVGQACGGNSGNCCSGLCEGAKPKKGKKDKTTCVAHNVEGCQVGQDACETDIVPCGAFAACLRTTGNAGFCGEGLGGICIACTKDTDCESTHGTGASCVICTNTCPDTDTLCVKASV